MLREKKGHPQSHTVGQWQLEHLICGSCLQSEQCFFPSCNFRPRSRSSGQIEAWSGLCTCSGGEDATGECSAKSELEPQERGPWGLSEQAELGGLFCYHSGYGYLCLLWWEGHHAGLWSLDVTQGFSVPIDSQGGISPQVLSL